MQIRTIYVDEKEYEVFETRLGEKTFVLLKAESYYICCGYLNADTAEKFGDSFATVKGVSSAEDMLVKTPTWISTALANKGALPSMTVEQILRSIK